MGTVRQLVKKIPGAMYLYRLFVKKIPGVMYLHRLHIRRKLENASTEEIFTDIFTEQKWKVKDSVSGPGSDIDHARVIIKELPILFRDLSISTMLDIPCGDFHWMNSVNLDGIDYIGADIVEEIIRKNREKHKRENLRFQHLNLIVDDLPEVDLIFCRDCLIHFCFNDILLALRNIHNSRSQYLLTTTTPSQKNNHDILTGEWRPLNLEVPPINLPKPLRIINEGWSYCNSRYSDKSLGLWQIEEIKI